VERKRAAFQAITLHRDRPHCGAMGTRLT